MFICQRTGQVTAPRQPMTRIVVQVRPKQYMGWVEGEYTVVGNGTEIAVEHCIAAPLAEPARLPSLLMNEGKDSDQTLLIGRKRAMLERRTILVQRQLGQGKGFRLAFEITPEGVVYEIPATSMVVPALECVQDKWLYWAARESRGRRQRERRLAEINRFAQLVGQAEDALKAEAKSKR